MLQYSGNSVEKANIEYVKNPFRIVLNRILLNINEQENIWNFHPMYCKLLSFSGKTLTSIKKSDNFGIDLWVV